MNKLLLFLTFGLMISMSTTSAQDFIRESEWSRTPSRPWVTKALDLSKNSKKLRMVVDIPPNDRIRVFHLDRKICNSYISEIGPDLKSKLYLGDAGPISRTIAKRLYVINGITRLTFSPYEVDVEIGKAFSWKEIEAKVVRILRDVALGINRHVVSVSVSKSAKNVPIFVEKTQNISYRSFNTRHLLSNTKISMWDHPFTTYKGELDDELVELGPLGASLARKLVSIEGVKEIFIKPYEVNVIIGDAFTWESIQPQVVAVLQSEIAKHSRVTI